MNDFSKFYLTIIAGMFFSSIYILSPLDTIIHENLHCSGCYILSNDCSCNITYRFFDFNKPSYVKYKLNIKDNNYFQDLDYSYNCKIYSIGDDYSSILVSLLPYIAYPAYIFVLSIINICYFKYKKFTFLFIFLNGVILLISILSYLLIPSYELIKDFQSVSKILSYTDTCLLIANIIYLPTLSITLYILISIYKVHKIFNVLDNINYLKENNNIINKNINNINNNVNSSSVNIINDNANSSCINDNKNNNKNKKKLPLFYYYINNLNIIKNFQEYIKISDFIKSYNIISIFHLFKLLKIGLYFYIIINSQCYLSNSEKTYLTKSINMNLIVYYLFNVFNIILDLLLIIIIYYISNRKIKIYTFIIMPLTNILYFIFNWKYYILINSINSIIFIIYYLKNI